MHQEPLNRARYSKAVLKSLFVSSALALSAIGVTYYVGINDYREGLWLAIGVIFILMIGHLFIYKSNCKNWQGRKKPIFEIKNTNTVRLSRNMKDKLSNDAGH